MPYATSKKYTVASKQPQMVEPDYLEQVNAAEQFLSRHCRACGIESIFISADTVVEMRDPALYAMPAIPFDPDDMTDEERAEVE